MTMRSSIRTIDRDSARRLVTLTLDDGVIARLTYKQAAPLPFWLNPAKL